MKTHWALIFVLSILVAAVAEFLERLSLSGLGIPEIIGRALGFIGITAVLSVIPALIYWFIKKKTMPGLNGLVWSIWGLVAVFSTIGSYNLSNYRKEDAKQAITEIEKEYSKLTETAYDKSGTPQRIETNIDTTPKSRGEFGEMERFMKEYMDRLVAQRNDYLLELEAIGWNSILEAERIKNDARLSESKVMIKRAKTIVDKYEKKTAGLMQDTRLRIGAIAMSESTKKKMLEGFDKGMGKAGAQIDQQWNLEKQVVRQFENIGLLLAASKGWVVEGGQILFYSDAELARFNSYIQRIQQIVQQQEQIQKNSYAEVKRRLEAVRNAAER